MFCEKNSSWSAYESIKTSRVFKLVFANNTIPLFLIIYLYFLIPAVIAHIFNPTAELAILIGTPTNEANADIDTQPLTAETKTRKCSK